MYFTTILWWDKKKYSGGIKKAGDWNLEKKYIKYMDIFIFIYKEYLFFPQKWRSTPYSLVNLQNFYKCSDKSLKVSWLDIGFYTPKWCRLLTKLDFNRLLRLCPSFLPDHSSFPLFIHILPWAKTSLQQIHSWLRAALPHLFWFPYSLQVLFPVQPPRMDSWATTADHKGIIWSLQWKQNPAKG